MAHHAICPPSPARPRSVSAARLGSTSARGVAAKTRLRPVKLRSRSRASRLQLDFSSSRDFQRKGEHWGPPSIPAVPTHTLSVPICAHTRMWHAPMCIACPPSIPSMPPRPSPSPSMPTHACGMPPRASPARRPSHPCRPGPLRPHPCPHTRVACPHVHRLPAVHPVRAHPRPLCPRLCPCPHARCPPTVHHIRAHTRMWHACPQMVRRVGRVGGVCLANETGAVRVYEGVNRAAGRADMLLGSHI